MGNIIWDSSWNIGHAEIDGQHQRWVELFNELENAFLSKNRVDLQSIQRDTYKKILDYTRYHFASEEKYMHDTAYQETAPHWRLHKDFDRIVYEKYRELEKGEPILTSELLTLIKNWLLRHIQVEDKKFGLFLQKMDSPVK
jgi:hemerythrin